MGGSEIPDLGVREGTLMVGNRGARVCCRRPVAELLRGNRPCGVQGADPAARAGNARWRLSERLARRLGVRCNRRSVLWTVCPDAFAGVNAAAESPLPSRAEPKTAPPRWAPLSLFFFAMTLSSWPFTPFWVSQETVGRGTVGLPLCLGPLRTEVFCPHPRLTHSAVNIWAVDGRDP
jgi:hypothetical protein